MRYLDRMQPLALLALRLTLGIVLVGHGSHKVYGHMHEYAGYVSSLGLPAWLGYVSALTEFVGGVLLILGLFTRCAAIAVFINMCVAIARVHWEARPARRRWIRIPPGPGHDRLRPDHARPRADLLRRHPGRRRSQVQIVGRSFLAAFVALASTHSPL